jgi:ADP-ribose pyrophosphatase YjhB (NUDIX family)
MDFGLFVKEYPEKYLGKLISKIFWPPSTVTVLAYAEDSDDILALDLGGTYRLPGGFMERGEELKQAARREVKEETGFEVDVKNLLDVKQNESGGPEIFFEGKVVGGEKSGSWEGEPEFISEEKIKEKTWELKHSHIHEYLFPES